MVVSLIMGTVWGVMRSTRLRRPWVSVVLDVLVCVLKGNTVYVQLLIAYFVFACAAGINCQRLQRQFLRLACVLAAYVSQIVRGGMTLLPRPVGGLLCAGTVNVQTLKLVIIPQVLRVIVPMIGSELDQLLKIRPSYLHWVCLNLLV